MLKFPLFLAGSFFYQIPMFFLVEWEPYALMAIKFVKVKKIFSFQFSLYHVQRLRSNGMLEVKYFDSLCLVLYQLKNFIQCTEARSCKIVWGMQISISSPMSALPLYANRQKIFLRVSRSNSTWTSQNIGRSTLYWNTVDITYNNKGFGIL